METNKSTFWDPDSPGQNFDLNQITEPILFTEIVLTRFRAPIGADRDKYIEEERCGCLPPCFERRLSLTSVMEAEVEQVETENIEVLYDVTVSHLTNCCEIYRDLWSVQFSREMTVYTQFYRKTALSLVAEIGGYLGLFLGWSGLAFVAFFEGLLKSSKDEGDANLDDEKDRTAWVAE